jgi:hypothetical protein
MNDEGILNMLIASQAMGGYRAGTALYSTWQQLGGGRMAKSTAEAMQHYGLLNEGEWKSEGGKAQLSEEAKKRLGAMIGTDIMQFVHAIDEELKKRGITDPAERMRAVMSISGRQTTGRLLEEGVANYGQIAAERGRMKEAAGTDQAFANYQKTLEFNMNALANAWSNLVNAVASPGTDVVVKMLQSMTGALEGMKGLSENHPKVVRAILEAVVALAGGLAGLSVAALVAIGGIPAAIAGVVAALGTLALVHWNDISGGFRSVQQALTSFFDWLQGLAAKAQGFINALPGKVFGGSGKPAPSVDDFGRVIPNSFHPGSLQQRAQPINFSLNVDGIALARAVLDRAEAISRYPLGAAAGNGASAWESA